LHNATKDLLGGVYSGLLSADLTPGLSLVFFASTPFSYDATFRRSWIQLRMNAPGVYLKALDMYFYVDLTPMDPAEWHLIRIVYNRRIFQCGYTCLSFFPVRLLITADGNGTLKRFKRPEEEENWAGRERKGLIRDLDE
ncbi:hypothetical protein GGX14DRAFT_671907, partial [Mycena pura]